MKTRLFSFILLFVSFNCFSQATATFHDFSALTIDGDTLDFSVFYGKKIMVVNTASYCVYTYQYGELEDLYNMYRDSNFVIIGFPCNDFGAQEPHGDSTILDFCTGNYGVEFQMMSKVSIISADTAEVYKWLQKKSRNGVSNASITWNFHKFLIDEAGHWVAHYPSTVSPLDDVIKDWIGTPSVVQTTSINDKASIKLNKLIVSGNRLAVSFSDLSLEKTTIDLYAVNGQLISRIFSGMLHNDEVITAGTENLNDQIYLLRVINGNNSGIYRFAVVR